MEHAAYHRLFEGTSRQIAGEVVLRCALLALAVVRLAQRLMPIPQRLITGMARFCRQVGEAWLCFAKTTLAAGSCKCVAQSGPVVDAGLNPLTRGTSTIPSANVCATSISGQTASRLAASHELQAQAGIQDPRRPSGFAPPIINAVDHTRCAPYQHVVDCTRCAPYQQHCQPHTLRRLSAHCRLHALRRLSARCRLHSLRPLSAHRRLHSLRRLSAHCQLLALRPPSARCRLHALRPLSARCRLHSLRPLSAHRRLHSLRRLSAHCQLLALRPPSARCRLHALRPLSAHRLLLIATPIENRKSNLLFVRGRHT